jgi:ketosteroid isomerase-like protein
MDSPALDSHEVERRLAEPAPGTNLHAIQEAFRAFADGGAIAGAEALLLICHDDCRFSPPSAAGRVLEGREQVLAYYREAAAGETSISVHPRSFTEQGDEIVVSGSMRVIRSEGSFAESQVRWIYRFRDGLVEEARWSPRHSC